MKTNHPMTDLEAVMALLAFGGVVLGLVVIYNAKRIWKWSRGTENQ